MKYLRIRRHISAMSLSHVCLDTLRIRDGVTSLDQLLHPGGQSVLPLPMPLPVNTFVMRKQLWDFFENIVFETEGPRMLVITGIGGCGKTQLALKFMRLHESRFTSCFVIDGSSELQIRADTIRHVRSLGIEHSQKSFDECLRYLTQSSLNGPIPFICHPFRSKSKIIRLTSKYDQ